MHRENKEDFKKNFKKPRNMGEITKCYIYTKIQEQTENRLCKTITENKPKLVPDIQEG